MNLSIIIPAYNKPNSLRRTVLSVKRNAPNAELIIVYDDGTDQAPEDISANKILYIGAGNGAIHAISRGISLADNPYVLFIGDDTELLTPYTDDIISKALSNLPWNAVMGFNDGISKGRAHPAMRRKYWISGGGFPTCYKQLYADTEIYKLACYHDNWFYFSGIEILHHHPYAEKHGKKVNILENTQSDSKKRGKNDGELHKKRMRWWEENGKPRNIPWNIK